MRRVDAIHLRNFAVVVLPRQKSAGIKHRLLGLTVLLLLVAYTDRLRGQLSTEDHLAEPGFWPRQTHSEQEPFASDRACARCHSSLAKTQALSRMAQAAMPASAASLLHSHPDLSFHPNQYFYSIETQGIGEPSLSKYSIGDGSHRQSFPLAWAFGAGRVGQSYLFAQDDSKLYEARVTYYERLQNIAFTPARTLMSPSSMDEAMFREIPPSEVVRCFSCHTTASTLDGALDVKHLVPGIHCEACHGPGTAHVAAMETSQQGKSSASSSHIFNPAELSPTESVEFCGSCHGSYWDVRLAKVTGVSTARSAPYRLVTSKCWAKGMDQRLKCTACHDPHGPLETRIEAYDSACLRCHSNGTLKPSRPGQQAACPKATAKCASCHMPSVYVPDMNDSFTDHRIRIARAGEAFPE